MIFVVQRQHVCQETIFLLVERLWLLKNSASVDVCYTVISMVFPHLQCMREALVIDHLGKLTHQCICSEADLNTSVDSRIGYEGSVEKSLEKAL